MNWSFHPCVMGLTLLFVVSLSFQIALLYTFSDVLSAWGDVVVFVGDSVFDLVNNSVVGLWGWWFPSGNSNVVHSCCIVPLNDSFCDLVWYMLGLGFFLGVIVTLFLLLSVLALGGFGQVWLVVGSFLGYLMAGYFCFNGVNVFVGVLLSGIDVLVIGPLGVLGLGFSFFMFNVLYFMSLLYMRLNGNGDDAVASF